MQHGKGGPEGTSHTEYFYCPHSCLHSSRFQAAYWSNEIEESGGWGAFQSDKVGPCGQLGPVLSLFLSNLSLS